MKSSDRTTRSAPSARACTPRRARLGGVARDVTHRRVELGKRDRKLGGGFGHDRMVPCAATNCNCMLQTAPMRSAMANIQNRPAMHQRDADRGGAHVLDPPDLRIMVGGETVGELLDGGVEQFDDQHQDDGRDEFDAPHVGHADQPRQRQRQHQRHQLFANGLLGTNREGKAVAGIDRGPPEPQQLKALPRPASA